MCKLISTSEKKKKKKHRWGNKWLNIPSKFSQVRRKPPPPPSHHHKKMHSLNQSRHSVRKCDNHANKTFQFNKRILTILNMQWDRELLSFCLVSAYVRLAVKRKRKDITQEVMSQNYIMQKSSQNKNKFSLNSVQLMRPHFIIRYSIKIVYTMLLLNVPNTL